jgi:hypothetical protein
VCWREEVRAIAGAAARACEGLALSGAAQCGGHYP